MKSVVDLFCGAGGLSEGLAQACERLAMDRPALVAINHWTLAVETHKRNHPWADHYCARAESLQPKEIVSGGRADLIVAGVECTHHSQARGGKPMNDQSRSSAWNVVHWAETLKTRDILIENVPAFLTWGPLNSKDRPIKSRSGETFRAFVQALESLNYRVEWRVLNSADYGDPQRRRRLFVRARAHRRAIVWPDETHAAEANGLEPWRTAREIIDWSDLGTSIFRRKRPLAPRTLARIAAGIERYCGEYAGAFLAMLSGDKASVLEMPTDGNWGGTIPDLAQPFLIPRHGERPTQAPRTHSVDKPLPTVASANPTLVLPFILPHDQWVAKNGAFVDDVRKPLRTVTARRGNGPKVVSPFLAHVTHHGSHRVHDLDKPTPTITGANRGELALVTPDGIAMDIFFRMLQPRELARAQGFPDNYEFVGNKGQVVKQIGNAVPVNTAAALCESILSA